MSDVKGWGILKFAVGRFVCRCPGSYKLRISEVEGMPGIRTVLCKVLSMFPRKRASIASNVPASTIGVGIVRSSRPIISLLVRPMLVRAFCAAGAESFLIHSDISPVLPHLITRWAYGDRCDLLLAVDDSITF